MAPLQIYLVVISIIVFFAGYPSATVAQNITSSDLRNGSACPGIIYFTCETRGSFAIAWSSEQYIGTGNVQLIFAADQSFVGQTRKTGGTIVAEANLTYKAIENGVQVLVSILTINVTQNFPGGSVTCMHVGDGTTDTIDFEVIAAPGVPQDVFAVQVEHVIDNCIVTAFWRSPNNDFGNINYEIRGYNTFANGTNLSNDTIISGTSDNNEIISTLLFVPGCFAHFISVSAVNKCGQAGPESTPVELDPENRHRANTSCASDADPDTDSGSTKSNPQPGPFVIMTVMTMTYMLVMLM